DLSPLRTFWTQEKQPGFRHPQQSPGHARHGDQVTAHRRSRRSLGEADTRVFEIGAGSDAITDRLPVLALIGAPIEPAGGFGIDDIGIDRIQSKLQNSSVSEPEIGRHPDISIVYRLVDAGVGSACKQQPCLRAMLDKTGDALCPQPEGGQLPESAAVLTLHDPYFTAEQVQRLR